MKATYSKIFQTVQKSQSYLESNWMVLNIDHGKPNLHMIDYQNKRDNLLGCDVCYQFRFDPLREVVDHSLAEGYRD